MDGVLFYAFISMQSAVSIRLCMECIKRDAEINGHVFHLPYTENRYYITISYAKKHPARK